MLDRKTAVSIVVECLKDVLAQNEAPVPDAIGDDAVLVGPGALLDSLGVVALIVDIEGRLDSDHQVSVVLANDKAMSQKNSPFRTVGVLADHVLHEAAQVKS